MSRLARSIGKIPYAIFLFVLQRVIAFQFKAKPAVWPRNSYLTNAFRPFFSDLDLTIWFQSAPSVAELQRLRALLVFAKKIFPALGETNAYDDRRAVELASWSNRFEIERDPETYRRLSKLERLTTERAQRTAFLLRMLESDAKNLAFRPQQRWPKWRRHFEAVGIVVSREHFDRTEAIALIAKLALEWTAAETPPTFYQATYESTVNYIKTVAGGAPSLQGDAWAAMIFPHRFCFREPPVAEMSSVFLEICVAQTAWEVWGLATQVHAIEAPDSVDAHFKRLAEFLSNSKGDVVGLTLGTVSL